MISYLPLMKYFRWKVSIQLSAALDHAGGGCEGGRRQAGGAWPGR